MIFDRFISRELDKLLKKWFPKRRELTSSEKLQVYITAAVCCVVFIHITLNLNWIGKGAEACINNQQEKCSCLKWEALTSLVAYKSRIYGLEATQPLIEACYKELH